MRSKIYANLFKLHFIPRFYSEEFQTNCSPRKKEMSPDGKRDNNMTSLILIELATRLRLAKE